MSRRLASSIARGLAAITDQGGYSGANFLMNVALARLLVPDDYGAFALAFGLTIFMAGPHTALVLEPMTVLGPGKYHSALGTYLLHQQRIHWTVTLPLLLVLLVGGAGALAAGAPAPVPATVVSAGVALPFILWLWVARRLCYLVRLPGRAAASSSLYLLLLAIAIAGLHHASVLHPVTAFLALGGVSWLAAIPGGRTARQVAQVNGHASLPFAGVLRQHWKYGRWQLVAVLLAAAGTQAQVMIAAGILGLASAGALRAMQLGVMPLLQSFVALSLLLLPGMANDYAVGELGRVRRKGMIATGVFTAIAVAYCLLLITLGGPLELLMFGGRFAEHSRLLAVFGLQGVFFALTMGPSMALRAVQQPQHYLVAGLVAGAVGVISAVVLTAVWGLAGAAGSTVLTYAAAWLVTMAMYRRWWWDAKTTDNGDGRV